MCSVTLNYAGQDSLLKCSLVFCSSVLQFIVSKSAWAFHYNVYIGHLKNATKVCKSFLRDEVRGKNGFTSWLLMSHWLLDGSNYLFIFIPQTMRKFTNKKIDMPVLVFSRFWILKKKNEKKDPLGSAVWLGSHLFLTVFFSGWYCENA